MTNKERKIHLAMALTEIAAWIDVREKAKSKIALWEIFIEKLKKDEKK